MAGHAGQACREPGGARYRRDDADRQIQAFQHRPLLDVQFKVGKQFGAGPCSRSDMAGIEAELRKRVAQQDSFAVLYAKHALVQRSGDRPAPQQRGREPDALLAGERLPRSRRAIFPLQVATRRRRKCRDQPSGPSHCRRRERCRSTSPASGTASPGLALVGRRHFRWRRDARAFRHRASAQDKVGRRAIFFGKMRVRCSGVSEIAASSLMRPTISSPSDACCGPASGCFISLMLSTEPG